MSLPKATPSEAFDETLLAQSGPRSRSREDDVERWVGIDLDHFTIKSALGSGGMGAVYLAHDRSLDRQVALKILPEQLADRPELQERFVREARAQARLQSAHVTHIYFVGRTPPTEVHPSSLYFAMEYVDGGTLESYIEDNERLDPEKARLAMIQVAHGLRAAQSANIIHRDIKPSNLLVSKDGTIKIADFGVAKPLDDTESQITQDGMVVGSPLYMPPEQAKGETIDHRADQYALGASFFHLLAGRPPFDGPTPLAVVSKHMTEAPPKLDTSEGVPAQLATIIDRLLSKDRGGRYETYDELIAALEAAAPGAVQYGGFWTRAAAVLVDVGLAGFVIGFLGWPALAVHLVYVTIAHAYRGQTLGKYLLNLRATRSDGAPLGLGRSFVRTVISLWLPFMIGATILFTEGRGQLTAVIEQMQPAQFEAFQSFLIALAVGNALLSVLYLAGLGLALVHPQKRAAHDLLCGSQVIYALRD